MPGLMSPDKPLANPIYGSLGWHFVGLSFAFYIAFAFEFDPSKTPSLWVEKGPK